tara:strand:+ start:181 stop:531 length:351 start_codon:yes stop_codon:yes gene_type:complete
MKPIDTKNRLVANINTGKFVPFLGSDGTMDGEVLQVNGRENGFGFHIYRMLPGQHSIPHKHTGDEEFLLIEGDLKDHDGYIYHPGDIVCLKSGTEHNSISQNGCLLAVYLPDAEGF